jgi:hypothetical protein
MRHLSFIIAILLITNQEAFSQTDTMAGKKGLMFSFSGLNLGGGVGGKYWCPNGYALRAQINGNYMKRIGQSYESDMVSLSLGIEKHIDVSSELSPYCGASLAFSRTSDLDIYYNKLISYAVNVYGFVGVELWIHKSISLSGEQGLLLTHSTSENKQSTLYLRTSTSSLTLMVYF